MKLIQEFKSYFIILSTIIGLGVFVLPYTFSLSGYYFFLWLIFWSLAFFVLHLLFGEILFQTEKKHNLPGLAGIYLHPYAKHLVWIFDYFGMLGVFLAYFIALRKFWSILFPVDPLIIKLLFAFFNLYFIFKEISIFAKFETVLSLVILFLFLSIAIFLLPHFNWENVVSVLENSSNPLLPYGILLFAFSGISSLPIVYDLLGKDKKAYLRVNLFALITVFLLYLFYSSVVVGFLGFNVSEESLTSLAPYFPKLFIILAVILVTLNIVFVDFAFYLKRGLIYDYGVSKEMAHLILFFSILPLAFWEPLSLVPLIELISSIFLAVNLIIIALIYLRLKEKIYFRVNKILIFFLILVFILGVIYALK